MNALKMLAQMELAFHRFLGFRLFLMNVSMEVEILSHSFTLFTAHDRRQRRTSMEWRSKKETAEHIESEKRKPNKKTDKGGKASSKSEVLMQLLIANDISTMCMSCYRWMEITSSLFTEICEISSLSSYDLPLRVNSGISFFC